VILIDTSALIEFLNRTGSPADVTLERLISDNAQVALADIVLTEVLQGIRDDREHRAIQVSLSAFPCLSLSSRQSYLAAADLYRACRKRGFTVRRTVDLLIAQTALEHDAELLHNDRDFDVLAEVCGLKIHPLMSCV
jgi:hypothetical protein